MIDTFDWIVLGMAVLSLMATCDLLRRERKRKVQEAQEEIERLRNQLIEQCNREEKYYD